MDPRLACQQGTSDDLTNQLGYGSDFSMSPVMWNGEEFYPREAGSLTRNLSYQQRQPTPQRGDAYHVTSGYPPQGGGGGGPSGGPQMRTMSMAPMTQPQQQGPAPTSTPPGDLSKLHMQGPGQMPHGGQMQIPFQVATSAPRQNAPNYTSYSTRGPAPRMPSRNPQAMYSVSGNGQQIMTQGQQMGTMGYMPYTLPVIYPTPASRLNSTATPFYAGHQQPQMLVTGPNGNYFPQVYFHPGAHIRGTAPQANMSAPHQGQQTVQQQTQHGPSPPVSIMPISNMISSVNTPSQPVDHTNIPAANTAPASNPPASRRRKHAIDIVNPVTGRNVIEDMEKETSASGGSSNSETPQPEQTQNQNHDVVAEFAERVNKAATEDSTPSAPTQPPDPSQPTGSINGPASVEAGSDVSLSQSGYVDESGSIASPWNKSMSHKGPADISEKPHDSPHVYFYSSVIPHAPNVSAKTMDIGPEMYQAGMPTIMLHVPGRQGASLSNSLAISEQTPVVSANTNAPSVPVEVYREPYPAISSRGPQQAGSGGSSAHQGHPSPNRRKRQENNVSSSNAQTANMASSQESNSQAVESKHLKKGSPTPGSAPNQPQGQGRPAQGASGPKDSKRDKGRERAATPKDNKETSDKPEPTSLKGKTSPPCSAATSPGAVVAAAPAIPATAPTVQVAPAAAVAASAPASAPPASVAVGATAAASKTALTTPAAPVAVTPISAAPAAVAATAVAAAASAGTVDLRSEKMVGARSRQASSESLTDLDAKAASRSKGKKMRDSNAKNAEKDGSDAEALGEPAVEDCAPPAPSEQAAAPITPAPAPADPVPDLSEVPDSGPAVAADAAGESAELPSATPAAILEPEESASVTPKTASEPTPAVQDAPNAVATPAAPAPAPTPAPAHVPAPLNPLNVKTVNMFNPDFLQSPTPPPIISSIKSLASFSKHVPDDGEKDDTEKEDKLVAAKNEENNKVSGILRDDQTPAEKKRNYGADQWSPLNPDGKKKYDRSFLMDLRSDPQSQKKPDGLPDMDVVLKESNKRAMQNSFSSEFSPAGFIRSSGSRGPLPKRNSQQGKQKPGKPAMVHLSISLRENVKLHETENAWKPGIFLGPGKEASEDDAATQDLYKRFRGILNKLTPEKFEKLVSQVQELPIDTPERLKGVINLVFDKAVDEPNFSVAYAKLCNELRSKEVQIGTNTDEKSSLTFRKILISRCQQEFEKNKAAENNKGDKLKEIEAEPDLDKRKELQLTFDEEERRVRMKSVGNIRFIGELYKLGMLTGQIMHRCVAELLSKNDEESLECLCKLLTTIGKKLEMDYAKGTEMFTDYWARMKDLADKKGKGKKISSRVRFMLQDVIDLRANNWVPRRDDSNPKTMDQIQKEAERDLMDTSLALSQPNTPRREDRGKGGMDKRGGRGGQTTDEAGWKMAPSRSSRLPLDVSKLKTSRLESESFGSPQSFSKWATGSTVKESSLPKKSTPILSANMYSALEKAPYNSTEKLKSVTPPLPSPKERNPPSERASASNSRSSSQQRVSSSQPASRDSSSVRGEREDERRNRVPTPSTGSPAEQSADERSSGSETVPVCKGKRLEDPEEIERCAGNLMQELLGHEDLKEAALGVVDYFDWNNIGDFVRECMVFMCDRKTGHQLVSNFFLHLHRENYLRNSHLVKAISEVIEMGPDLVIDIPKVWTHIAALIAPLLIGEAVTFKDLAKASEVLKGTPPAGELLNNIIQILVKEKTPSWIQQHWESSGVSWADFLDAGHVDEFIKENHLESFSSGALASRSEMTPQQIQDKLLELLRPEAKTNFDAVVEWIEANVGEKTSENFFIRALMTAICESALKENTRKLDQDRFKQHEKLITRYVNNKDTLELQCLYAVQALINRLEHPQGLILTIFNLLWESSVISSEAFFSWFNSKDPQEMEGKGVCSTSLTSFQTMLTEVDDADDEDS